MQLLGSIIKTPENHKKKTEKTLKGITESKDIAYVELKTDTGESFKSGKRKANEKIIESVFDIFFNEDLLLESKKVKIEMFRCRRGSSFMHAAGVGGFEDFD